MTKYTPIIGMEVHVELATLSKMFCRCDAHHFRVAPNTHVCPVCMGLPGAMPVPNRQAIEDTVKIGLALGCSINLESKFDRKHYFYPDLPKGYQISQYDQPLCYSGSVTLSSGRKVRVTRVHLEEDTGKLVHKDRETFVDYNRSSVPLVEIVSEPDITSSEEAKEYLKFLHSTVRFLGVSEADMEKGSMRLEANISVSRDGVWPEYKVEVKNVNSFRYISYAIDYEIKRQTALLEKGETPRQETRGWNLDKHCTYSQRVKETAKDYRYFPEPDIPPMVLTAEYVDSLKAGLPLLPFQVIDTLAEAGVRIGYAQTISENKELAPYAIEVAQVAKTRGLNADTIIGLVVNSKLDWQKHTATELVEAFQAQQTKTTLDESQTQTLAQKAIDANPQAATDYKNGKLNSLQFLLGQVMKEARGSADPQLTRSVLEKLLS